MLVLILSFTIAFSDQVTKHLVRCTFPLGGGRTLLPGLFDLRYVRNTGAAWGMLSGLNHWLVVLSLVMLVVITVFRRRFLTDSLIHRVALGLMVGGIVGNLVDRMRLGYVVDFLDFYWRTRHFPAFNVADSAICVGVGLYIASQLLQAPRCPEDIQPPVQHLGPHPDGAHQNGGGEGGAAPSA